MQRLKKKPQPVPLAAPSMPTGNGPGPPGEEVLTLAETAAYLRLPESDVVRLIGEQSLPARQVGAEWRFLKSAIQQWLQTGSPPLQANKEAWMALAGAWKDDPYVEEEVKEIYRQRGRPMTEDEK